MLSWRELEWNWRAEHQRGRSGPLLEFVVRRFRTVTPPFSVRSDDSAKTRTTDIALTVVGTRVFGTLVWITG